LANLLPSQSDEHVAIERRRAMKKFALLAVAVVFGFGVLGGCATIQTWPDNERRAENKMVVIQEQIGEGLKTGALTPDQSQSFLAKLKVIRTDYSDLRDKSVERERWDSLLGRLDALSEEINRASGRALRIEGPWSGDRILTVQRRIDDGRINGRLPQTEGREFQARLDGIRRDYMRMTDGGSYTERDERTGISRRLDSLETDLNRSR